MNIVCLGLKKITQMNLVLPKDDIPHQQSIIHFCRRAEAQHLLLCIQQMIGLACMSSLPSESVTYSLSCNGPDRRSIFESSNQYQPLESQDLSQLPSHSPNKPRTHCSTQGDNFSFKHQQTIYPLIQSPYNAPEWIMVLIQWLNDESQHFQQIKLYYTYVR